MIRISTGLLFSIATLLTLAACSVGHSVPEDLLDPMLITGSHIEDLRRQTTLSPSALVTELGKAELLVIGEDHVNTHHHAIEQWLLTRLPKTRPQGSVLMEMIDVDQQSDVNAVKQGMRSGAYLRDERIQQLLQWRTGWPWPLYRGVVLTALAADYPLLAGNLSSEQTTMIYQTRQFPPGKHSARESVRAILSAAIKQMHDGKMAPDQLRSMLAVQQHRDRFMASQLLNAPKPALLIAGGYHAAKNLGVPLHLADIHGQTAPVVLILAVKGMQVSAAEADYVWYVPANDP
ncbi:ChaN family lipoprotein [Pectobacterium cacticida]|uniref:ChaN family lipoprotein n=1 Tax=Pectobacterium cacticida TaxID=69221 RepID=UPI003987FA7F